MNAFGRLSDWLDSIRSFIALARASSQLGRAGSLRRARRGNEALETARSALALLDKPSVRRGQAAEGALLVSLTVLTEELSVELDEPGASERDIQDSIDFLRAVSHADTQAMTTKKSWLPYLESRLQAIR